MQNSRHDVHRKDHSNTARLKGACGPLARDTTRIGTKRQIGSRNCWENAKRQVWNTILKREAAAMGYTHGRLASIGCQSFQLVSEGRLVIFSRQRRPDRTVGGESFVYVSFSGRQMPLTFG
jgi:hypothetical protein